MCGIAGAISLSSSIEIEPNVVEQMSRLLEHRGPDEDGTYFERNKGIALAFRRLAIIDLEKGSQPISNEDGNIHLVCNGEIYNFQTLRENLIAKNHRFKTAGDIEPIVHLYEDTGYDFINQLDGFFSLALFDSNEDKLILAVDRFGKKPFYYTIIDRCLYFASEMKAIREILSNHRLDKQAIIDYLRFGYIPAPATIFEDVKKIPPGAMLVIRQKYYQKLIEHKTPPACEYYRIRCDRYVSDYTSAVQQIKDLATRAVEKRLVADVPVGILLSGGLDSSIITALASRITGQRIKTFSVGFKDEMYNELPLAKLIADKYNTEHTELMIDIEPDLDSLLDSIFQIYDEPFADSSAIPMYKISQIASRYVKVALTGDGGDEAFMGYDRYRAFMITSALTKLGARPIGKIIEKFIPRPGHELRSDKTRFWRLIRALRFTPARQYSMFMRIFFERQLKNLISETMNNVRTGRIDCLAQMLDGLCTIKSPALKANIADILTYLPGDLLVKADRASMANSLELRSPFLDYRLMEFCKSLKPNWHMDVLKGKKLLRNAFGELLPQEILSAPKRGFGVPLGSWLRNELKKQMEKILNKNCRLIESSLVDNVYLVRIQAEHIAGMFDHSQRLWALMVLEKFLQKIG